MPTDYRKMYEKIFKLMGDLTPLKADCGLLCGGACCKGDENIGMRLFPHEQCTLPIKEGTLVVCNGSCDRKERSLECRIFPFFPTIDEKGRIYVESDDRALRLCPMLSHSDEIIFDPRFFKAVKRVGKLLAKDPECRTFLEETTAEIDIYRKLL